MVNIPPIVLKRDGALELYQTKWGNFWGFPNDLIIGKTVATDDIAWDPFVLELAEKYCNKDSYAIDIGAHFGFHTVCMAKWAKHVIAVEPIYAEYLYKNLVENNVLNQVTVINSAAFNTRGKFSIRDNQGRKRYKFELLSNAFWEQEENSGGFSLTPTNDGEIIGTALDSLVLVDSNYSFIKIDAQGMDLLAINGLMETIRKDRPAIVFEFERDLVNTWGHTWDIYVYVLNQFGYTMQSIKGWENNYLCLPR